MNRATQTILRGVARARRGSRHARVGVWLIGLAAALGGCGSDGEPDGRAIEDPGPVAVEALNEADAPAVEAASEPADPGAPVIRLVTPENDSTGAYVEVAGIPDADLTALQEAAWDREAWSALLRITVDRDAADQTIGESPAVLGAYAIEGGALRFRPMFPFDPGRKYWASLRPERLPGPGGAESWREREHAHLFALPAVTIEPTTVVREVYPTGEVLPENLLRMYIHLSAPMSMGDALPYIHILDAEGVEVPEVFLPLGQELWDRERRRYTIFFDPGRVKQELRPNLELGRAIREGRRYTLLIDARWKDDRGAPMKEAFRRDFRVGPPADRPIDPADWTIAPPAVDTREALTVTFPAPLDRALLMRALGVSGGDGAPVAGQVAVSEHETRWEFTPAEPWTDADYLLTAATALEDVAGNQIGKAFEVDQFGEIPAGGPEEPTRIRFRPR